MGWQDISILSRVVEKNEYIKKQSEHFNVCMHHSHV